MKKYQNSTLANGLNLITSTDENSDIVTIGLFVKAGARYEAKREFGCAHLLEHMLLKGSKHYPSVFNVAVVTDRAGAYLNASTGAEKVILTIQVAKSALKSVFALLADIIKNPLFNTDILENEKNVIKQEIGKVFDSHLERIWLETVSEIFPGHPLGHHPIGDVTSVSALTATELTSYSNSFFVPQRATLVVSGGMAHDEILGLANEHLADWRGSLAVAETPDGLSLPRADGPRFKFIPIDSRQTYLNIVFSGPRLNLKEQLITDIISEYLGHGRTSLLNQELRQKTGLVYSLFVGGINYQDASLLRIFMATNEPEKVIRLTLSLLEQASDNLSDPLLSEYKEQMKNGLQRIWSDPFREIDFLGGNWVLHKKLVTPADIFSLIDSITSTEVARMWKEYLNKDSLTMVALGGKSFIPDC